jgi:hypothetical protein
VAHAVKVRGRLSDPRHIELDEPVDVVAGPVEVVLQEAAPLEPLSARSFVGLCADLGRAPSAEEIDETRRDAWATFPRDDVS